MGIIDPHPPEYRSGSCGARFQAAPGIGARRLSTPQTLTDARGVIPKPAGW